MNPLEEAKARMRSERKPGLVIRLPSDPRKRHDLGHRIESLVNSENPEIRGLFQSLVFVCLESEAIQEHLPGARPEDTLIAIFADGDPFGGVPFPLPQLAQETRLTQQVRDLLHGTQPGPVESKEMLLPYGIQFGRPSVCGDACEEREERRAVACGMAFLGRDHRSFIRFLST